MVAEDGSFVQYYPGFPSTASGWNVTPEVMHYGMVDVYRRYGLPIYITENGVSYDDMLFEDGQVHDPWRKQFLRRYLIELSKAIDEGVPIKGYLQWSFLDNFEWGDGYTQRFGMVYVDYPTLRRIPKDSAYWYAEVMESNGISLNEVPNY